MRHTDEPLKGDDERNVNPAAGAAEGPERVSDVGLPPSDRNLVALFRDPGHARTTMVALERHGIDGGQISFSSSRSDAGLADYRFASLGIRRLLVGGLAGLVAGLVAGAVVALVLDATTDAQGGAVWAGTLLGFAVCGSAMGSFFALISLTAGARAWRQALEADPDHLARLVVHLHENDDLDGARASIEDHDAVSVRLVDRRGRVVSG